MSHFAQLNQNNIVMRVLVIEQDVIDSGVFGDPSTFIQTSYNTRHGVHNSGGTPLRKNYAGVGYTYDPARDAFIPPKPYDSWTLNEDTCDWEAPIARPTDGKFYTWNDADSLWEEVPSHE